MRQFQRDRREHRRRMNELADVEQEEIAWGKERKGTRSTVIVLDPPLAKVSGPDRVDVEWFYHRLDASGNTRGPVAASYVTAYQWSGEVLDRTGLPINFIERLVASHATGPNHFAEERRRIQQTRYGALHLFHDRGWEMGRSLMGILSKMWHYERGGSLRTINTRQDAEALATKAEIPLGVWRVVTEGHTRAIIEETDRRWKEVVRQGTGTYRKTFEGLADPVLLIDGKYLVTANTMRRQGKRGAVKRALQTANWLIGRQLEKIERGAASAQPRTGTPGVRRMASVDEPLAREYPGEFEIEVLYSYISDEGEYNEVMAADEEVGRWFRSLQARGIEGVTVFWTPVSGQGPGAERQRRHQRLMLGWERWKEPKQMEVHMALGAETFDRGGRINTDEAEERFLRNLDIHPTWYRARLARRKSKERIAAAQAKAEAARRVLTREGPEETRGLVFLVNGTTMLEAEYSRDLGEVFGKLEKMLENAGK